MTLENFSARDRLTVIIGAVTIVLLLGGSRAIPWWRRAHREVTVAAADARERLAFEQSLLRSERAARDSATARSRRYLALAPRILPGRSPAIAAAELAAMVSGAAQGSGLRVGAVQVQPDTTRLGVFARVAVRAQVTGDVRGVSALLLTLERGPLVLNIRELSLAQLDAGADDTRPEMLRGEMLVEALSLAAER
ncbi:MAG TPA: type II secretion system protein GspM [Gemmatimonadaceae bacterium]|jgi:hypothetical protein|nr:type II secretion system protein GspM [Gemmatimonadaceae bacterium]